jgi:phosphate transport system substrate-binding protein
MMPAMTAVRETRPEDFAKTCTRMRDDGPYIDAGENDNLIVQKLRANPDSIGIFGYSYLEENKDRLNGVPLNGIEPTYETIASGQYPGSRPLFLYVKKAHLSAIPNLRTFLNAYTQSWSPDGPLVRRGLIAAPTDMRARSAAIVQRQTLLDPKMLR